MVEVKGLVGVRVVGVCDGEGRFGGLKILQILDFNKLSPIKMVLNIFYCAKSVKI